MHVFVLFWISVSMCSNGFVLGIHVGVLLVIFQGFLAKDLQAEALNKLDHRVKVASEQFMKILEEIDAMVRIFKFSFT